MRRCESASLPLRSIAFRRFYLALANELGEPAFQRVDAPATPAQRKMLSALSPQQIRRTDLVGEKISAILTRAPGNDAPIGGVKVIAEHGWFAARPSGTEAIYKVYAESFRGPDHLQQVLEQAQAWSPNPLPRKRSSPRRVPNRMPPAHEREHPAHGLHHRAFDANAAGVR